MSKEGFLGRVGNKVRTAVVLGGAMAFSGGALDANQLEIAKAQTAVTMAQFKVDHTKFGEKKLKPRRLWLWQKQN